MLFKSLNDKFITQNGNKLNKMFIFCIAKIVFGLKKRKPTINLSQNQM